MAGMAQLEYGVDNSSLSGQGKPTASVFYRVNFFFLFTYVFLLHAYRPAAHPKNQSSGPRFVFLCALRKP